MTAAGWGPSEAGEGQSPSPWGRRAKRAAGTHAAGVGPRGLRPRGGAARPVAKEAR